MDKLISIGRALYFYYVARKNLFYSSLEPGTSEDKLSELKNRLNDRWGFLKGIINKDWQLIIDTAKNHDSDKQKARLIILSGSFYLDHTPEDWNDLEAPVKLMSHSLDGKKLKVNITPLGTEQGWSVSSSILIT